MKRMEKSVFIKAPVESVFRYLSNPKSIEEWLPSMMEVKDITVKDGGVGTNYRWKYRMAGMELEGESVCTDWDFNRRLVTRSRGGISSTWDWLFEDESNGTKVTLVVEYSIPVPVLGRLAEALVLKQNRKEAEAAMNNIKEKCEG